MANTTTSTEQSKNMPLAALDAQVLFNAVTEAMLLVDTSGHVIQANLPAQQLCGYALEELRGLDVEALMPLRFREHHRQYRKMYQADPHKRTVAGCRELALLNRAGQEITVNINLIPVTVKNDFYILVTLIIPDRRRRAECALHESEERLWLIKQATGVGIFDFDCVSDTVYCDERFHELWGNETDRMMTFEQFCAAIHPRDRANWQSALDKAVDPAGDGKCAAEFRVIHSIDQSKRWRWISVLGQAQFEKGVARRIVGIARNVTERKMLELELQKQRNEAERLFNKQVAILTASAIAHELNSPLTAISAFGEVGLHALSGTSADHDNVKESLENCVQLAQHAGQRLYELLGFLQNDEIVTEPLNLNRIVEDALMQARSDGYGEFHLALRLESGLSDVLANKIQIQRVLMNLIRNGVEAMRAANIAASEIAITVKTLAKDSMAMVTVRDNGPGIDSETVHRIFEPFFTTKPTGIGVGLAISRALIEANGGQLWIDPDFRQGARFNFTLPFAS